MGLLQAGDYGYGLTGVYGLSPHPRLGKRENYGFKRGYGF